MKNEAFVRGFVEELSKEGGIGGAFRKAFKKAPIALLGGLAAKPVGQKAVEPAPVDKKSRMENLRRLAKPKKEPYEFKRETGRQMGELRRLGRAAGRTPHAKDPARVRELKGRGNE